MKVIGKDIGPALDAMYADLEQRVRVEGECELRVEPFEAGAFSSVDWEPGACVVSLHNGVPTHALPHVLGVALQHIRQHLDRYPTVVNGPRDMYGGDIVRTTLRELVMAPEAELALAPLNLDITWEIEQRHAGLKDLLRDAPKEWDDIDSPGGAFAALQYARFAIEHPADLWATLKTTFAEKLPHAAEQGERIVAIVREKGLSTPGACLETIVAARDALNLAAYAGIEDLRNGAVV